MPVMPISKPNARLLARPALALLFLVALVGALALCSSQSWAQLVIVDERYYVTEIRADQNKIGISEGQDGKTRTWVDVESKTRIATSVGSRSTNITRRQMYSSLKPGTRIRVNGGRDWDQHIVAKKIWF